jgi:hypothetical protein
MSPLHVYFVLHIYQLQEILPPARLFGPALLFGTLEYYSLALNTLQSAHENIHDNKQ